MPGTTFLDISQREQAQMLATRRRLRYGDLRSLHVLLWCMAGRTPTEIAACLFCSRSSVYRTMRAYRTGTLAMTLKAKREIQVSAEMRRRWLHELGWVWKHATFVARDDDPHRVERFARIRFVFAHLKADAAMVFADKLAIPYGRKSVGSGYPKGPSWP